MRFILLLNYNGRAIRGRDENISNKATVNILIVINNFIYIFFAAIDSFDLNA